MPTIGEIRSKYPQYNDMSDGQLADALYRKFYSDMDRSAFDAKIGFGAAPTKTDPAPVVETPRGNTTDNKTKLLLDYENVGSAGSQRTTPSIEAHRGSFLSDRTTTTETGEVLYQDPKTGEWLPTDQNKHVALRDPQDQKVKIFSRSANTDESAVEGVSRILSQGLATGPVSMRAAKGVPTLAPMPEQPVPTAAQLKDSYTAGLYGPVVSEAKIKPETANRIVQEVTEKLNRDLYDPTFPAYGQVNRLGREIPKEPLRRAKYNPETGEYDVISPRAATVPPVSVQDIEIVRQRLTEMSKGIPGSDKSAAGRAAGYIDDALSRVSQSDAASGDVPAAQQVLSDIRADYRAAKLSEALDKKLHKADLQTDATNSGLNIQNKLKQAVVQFLGSPDARGLKKHDVDVLESFVKGPVSERTTRYVANLLGGGGGLGTLSTGAVGTLAAGAPGALLPLGGFGLNRLNAALTVKQADKLSELFRSQTPLAKRMAIPVEEWNVAVEQAHTTPNARNLSRLLIASRNLSNNLRDADINISANELLRAIQGSKPAQADRTKKGDREN